MWRNELRDELRTNDSGHLPSRQPALSKSIPSDFPQLKIINLYRNPLSSKTNPTDLLGCSPHPILLANFAEENFCWGSSHGILSHFETTIFPALALDDICRIARETDLGLAKRPCQFIGEVLKWRVPLKARDCPRHPEVRLSLIVPDALVDSIIHSLLGKLNDGETEGKVNEWRLSVLPRMRVWLPIAMIHATFPDLIAVGELVVCRFLEHVLTWNYPFLANRKNASCSARMSTGGKAPRASGKLPLHSLASINAINHFQGQWACLALSNKNKRDLVKTTMLHLQVNDQSTTKHHLQTIWTPSTLPLPSLYLKMY